MIDIELIDRMFEAGRASGNFLRFGSFDKTMLLPLDRLPDAVCGETDEHVTADDLARCADPGW